MTKRTRLTRKPNALHGPDESQTACNPESKRNGLICEESSPATCFDPDPDLPPGQNLQRATRNFCHFTTGNCVCRAWRAGRHCPPMAAIVQDALAATGLPHAAVDLILTGPVAVTRIH